MSGTLLIMTRGAAAEVRRRRLLPRAAGNERVLHALGFESAMAAGVQAGCRIVISSPEPLDPALTGGAVTLRQRGRTFGERFADALARVFARFSGPVVVVGTDTPDLDAAHIRRAFAALGSGPGRSRVVLGPSRDGGFYLLGASRPLEDVAWESVSWCSRATRQTLRSALEQAGRGVVFLRPLADLDRPADLERWLAEPCRSAGDTLYALRRRLRGELARPQPNRPQPGAAIPAHLAESLAAAPDRAPPSV